MRARRSRATSSLRTAPMPAIDLWRWGLLWLGATAVAAAVFAAFPGIDLAVSGLFHDPDRGFWLDRTAAVLWLRLRLWDISIALVLVALVGLVIARAIGRPALWLPARVWGFILMLYVIGPGIIVNGILKAHWGRARPNRVTDFGGSLDFTPFYVVSDECGRNCSFVSGEGASSMALGIALGVILLSLGPRLGPRWRRGLFGAALAVPVVGGGLRLAAGGHFLSDTVFAGLIVAGLGIALYALVLHPVTRLEEGWLRRLGDRVMHPR